MAESTENIVAQAETHAEVQSEAHAGGSAKGFMTPDVNLLILTWVTFFALLAILQKFAWKPILDGLNAREESIRKSVEEAEKIKLELERINESRSKLITEAEMKARDIVEQSRKAAIEAAKTIEHKARNEAQIMIENALREIRTEKEKATAQLREESAQLIVQLSSKLIHENLDNKKNRELVDRLIKEI